MQNYLSNTEFYKNEIKINNQLFELGLITHVQKISNEIKIKSMYVTQIKESK
jgi:hypothetical protein